MGGGGGGGDELRGEGEGGGGWGGHLEPSIVMNSSATCGGCEGEQLRPHSGLTHRQPLQRDAARDRAVVPHDKRDAECGLKRQNGEHGKGLDGDASVG